MACSLNTKPLDEAETHTFFHRHLERVQAPKDLLENEAIMMMAAKTRGNRRELLNVAAVLLTEAMFRNEKTIGPQLVISSEFWRKTG